ncbi:DUF3224 domain-containing protein [[Pseudomonas] boreopolis]|uniref:DUF3224 domain-containing protein n=1 Tax=Xanthomonas boreopolis TaxID=86183 RepID=UPI003D9BD173
MKQHATGRFEVKLQPQASRQVEGNTLARMSLDKVFSGDLQGEGKGEMLAARTAVEGSAAYVAAEAFTGSVHGRSGSFLLVHRGWMEQGMQSLLVSVVPDSGTGELKGIAGTLGIRIEDGVHHYDFDYTLPDARAAPM